MGWSLLFSPIGIGLIALLASLAIGLWSRMRLLRQLHTQLLLSQTALQEAEHRFSVTMDAASDPLMLFKIAESGEARLLAANRAFAREAFPDRGLWDLGALLDRRPDEMVQVLSGHTRTRMLLGLDLMDSAIRSGHPVIWHDEWENDGERILYERSEIPILDRNVCTHLLRVAQNITARGNELEAKSYQSQKMEAIGTLAGGVAHDFNNILGAVVGKTNVALSRLPSAHYAKEPLDDILSACRRAKALVRQLMDFGRPDPGNRLSIDLGSAVRDVVRMMRSTASARIRFVVDGLEHKATVDADPSRLQQIVLNLVTNAVQAIGARTGTVRLSITTQNAIFGAGRKVVLRVEDDGCGMAPEILQRIYEPFFTTKDNGEGSGWGLAVTHAAVRELGGSIGVQSEPGNGTVFSVELPASEGCGRADESGVFDRSILRDPGTVRLLLVDDEMLILSAYAELLEALGCQVVRAQSPLKAIEILENREEAIDILITDLSMPHLSGLELARKAREFRPGLAMVLLSGNMGREEREQAEATGIGACLSKPVDVLELRKTIELLLGRVPSAEAAQAQLVFPGL